MTQPVRVLLLCMAVFGAASGAVSGSSWMTAWGVTLVAFWLYAIGHAASEREADRCGQ